MKDEKIQFVEGRDGPANKDRLCVKGRYGFDYVHNPSRLTKPLIRREGAEKTTDIINFDDRDKYFREASWEEALAKATSGLKTIRDQHGPNTLAGFGSAKGSNEEAYLFQKLIRRDLHEKCGTGWKNSNLDGPLSVRTCSTCRPFFAVSLRY